MGLIDVRRFDVAAQLNGGLLVVNDISQAERDEWDVNLAEVIRVNALAVPSMRSSPPTSGMGLMRAPRRAVRPSPG
jgi:hypothetical protein